MFTLIYRKLKLKLTFKNGETYDDPLLPYYEAWPVEKDQTTSSRHQGAFGNRYDDVYNFGYEKEGIVRLHGKERHVQSGEHTLTGIVKFYQSTLPLDFEEGKVWDAGGWTYSSYKQPPFWDGCGTAHNFEVKWDSASASGYMQRENQIHRFTVP